MTTWSRIARPTFHVLAVIEALTWLGLLAGMYVAYLGSGSRTGIEVFGPLHGVAFVAYVAVALAAALALRWSVWTTLLALVASIPPLGTVVFDVWASRTGRLERRYRAPATA